MSKSIDDLHPKLAPLCLELLRQCAEAGIDVRIIFTYRTPEDQDALYAHGRTQPGAKVTNLTGTQSLHCFEINGKPASKAFDIGVFDHGRYITNGGDPRYLKAGEIGEKLGLIWGGRWHDPHDPSHFQLKA